MNARAAPETWAFLAVGAAAAAWMALAPTSGVPSGVVVVLAIAVALVGLPHGALDPWLAQRAGLWRTALGCAVFHAVYMALAGGVVLAWLWAPGVSLAAFLAVSAWHFAGDWRPHLPGWARAIAGAALLALPAWRWPQDVSAAFALLSGEEGTSIADVLMHSAPWLAAAMAGIALMVLRRSPRTALELGAIAVLAFLLPPLAYFIVYFCALHSPRHLRLAAASAAPRTRARLAGVALFYTALTVLAAAAAWPWLRETSSHAWEGDLLRTVFIGLAALTLPHMLVVMHAERSEALTS